MSALTFVYRPAPVDFEAILLETLGQELLRSHPLDTKARVTLQAHCHKMKMFSKHLFEMSELKRSSPHQIRESCIEYIKMLAALRDNHFPDTCLAALKRLKLPNALFQKKAQRIETFEQEAALAARNGIVMHFNYALDQLYQIRLKPDGPKTTALKAAKGALDTAFQIGELFKQLFGKDTFTGNHGAANASTADEAVLAGAEFGGDAVPGPVLFLDIAQHLVEFCRAAVTYQFSLASDQLFKIPAKSRNSILSQQAMDCVNVALPPEVSRTWRQIPLAFYSLALYHKAEDFYNREDITDKKVFRNAWSFAEAAISNLKETPWEVKDSEDAVLKGGDSKNFFEAFAHSTIVGLLPLWEQSRNIALLFRDKLRKEGHIVHYGLNFVSAHHLEELPGTRGGQESPFRSRGSSTTMPNPFAGILPTAEQISENDSQQAQLALVRKGFCGKIQSALILGKEQCTRLRVTQVKVPAMAEGPIDTLFTAVANLESFTAQIASDLSAKELSEVTLLQRRASCQPTCDYISSQLDAFFKLTEAQVAKLERIGLQNQDSVKDILSTFCSCALGPEGVPSLTLKTSTLRERFNSTAASTTLECLGTQQTSNDHHQPGSSFTIALRKAIALNALSPSGSATGGGVLSDVLQQTAQFFEMSVTLFESADPNRLGTLSLDQLKSLLEDLNTFNSSTYPAIVKLNQSVGSTTDLTTRARSFQEACDSVISIITEAKGCLESLKGLVDEMEQEIAMVQAMSGVSSGGSFIGIVEDNTPVPSIAGDDVAIDDTQLSSKKGGGRVKKVTGAKKVSKANSSKKGKGRGSKRGAHEEEDDPRAEDASPAPRPTIERESSGTRASRGKRAVLNDSEEAPIAIGNHASEEIDAAPPGIAIQAPSQEANTSPTLRSDAPQRQDTSFLSTVSGGVGRVVSWAFGGKGGHTKAHLASQLKAEAKAATPDPDERPRKRQRK